MFDPNATTDELVSFALSHPSDGSDDDEGPSLYWQAVAALHERGTREVFDTATRLLKSPCGAERELGVNVHAQLGFRQEKPFAAESVRLLVSLLDAEHDPNVIYAVLIAFGHLHQSECVTTVIRFANHSDPDIRYGVAYGLGITGSENERAIRTLIELTNDPEDRVRDWATFALGTQTEWDSPELRAALRARLADSDNITRGEALKGLASRRDLAVLDAIIAELTGPDPHEYAVEAADILADPRLIPALGRLRSQWDTTDWLDRVIESCRAGKRE